MIASVTTFDDGLMTRFFAKTEDELPTIRWFWTGSGYEQVETSCRVWVGAKNDSGYGRFWEYRVKCWTAHLFAYVAAYGAIPAAHQVDHLCRNPGCVRDTHLEAVTEDENKRRQWLIYRLTTLTCSKGHLWTPENTGKNYNSRRCNQCNREKAREWNTTERPARPLSALTAACRNGHRRTEHNTRFHKSGTVICRDCQRDARTRWRQRKELHRAQMTLR